MSQKSTVVGVIMTYNCAPLVAGIYQRLPKELFDHLIIVDDGSEDDIETVASSLGLPLFAHPHTGYGGNIKYGLAQGVAMGGDIMIEIHGDGQFGTDGIVPGIAKMEEGCDFVMGSRFTDLRQPLRDKMPLIRYFGNIVLSFFDRLILQVPLSEFHGGFRVYSRKLVETVNFANTADDYLFSFEIIALAKFYGLKFGEVPVRADYSKDHTSISIKKAAIYALQTFGILGAYLMAKLGLTTKLFRHAD